MSGPPIIVYACRPFDRCLNGITAPGGLRAAHDIRSLGQGVLACMGLFGGSLAGAVCSALVLPAVPKSLEGLT